MFGLMELYFKCIHIFVMSESFFEWLILIITYFTPVKSRITSYSVFRKRGSWILLMKLTTEMKTINVEFVDSLSQKKDILNYFLRRSNQINLLAGLILFICSLSYNLNIALGVSCLKVGMFLA